MQRVMIVGQPGSGKSTLARELGAITGLPVVHVDTIHYAAGWRERPVEEKVRLAQAVHRRERWIFEGGLSRTWPERIARADTLIWLDTGLVRRVTRVVRRTIQHYGTTRPDLPDGCLERFDPSFYRWIWDTRRTGRLAMRTLFDDATVHKHCFTRFSQSDRWLQTLRSGSTSHKNQPD